MLSPSTQQREKTAWRSQCTTRPCHFVRNTWRLVTIIEKSAAHCAEHKIEESALLTDRLIRYFSLARQFRQAADFGRTTPAARRVAGPDFAAVDDTSFAAAKKRVEDSLAFVKTLTRAQIDGSETRSSVGWPAATSGS